MANYSPTINLIVAVHAKNQNKVTIYSPGIILGIKSKTIAYYTILKSVFT